MVTYQNTQSAYVSTPSYATSSSANYHVVGYRDTYGGDTHTESAPDRRCKGTCQTHDVCTCGSR
ncbi:MAG: hypothetical protein WC916_07665 [Candidatus Woesearchaeota archaeon]